MKLGFLAIGAALLNYRKAKAKYDALKEQKEALLASIDTYNENKYEEYDKWQEIAGSDEKRPDDFFITSCLRVANLVGKYLKGQIVVTLRNNGSHNVRIRYVKVLSAIPLEDSFEPVILVDGSGKRIEYIPVQHVLKPGETYMVKTPVGIGTCTDMGHLRDIICTAADKKLITSCPKIDIQDGVVTSFCVVWDVDSYFITDHKPGVLLYEGETGLKSW